MTKKMKDITPAGSVAPVFLDTTPDAPIEEPDLTTNVKLRGQAIAKLVALGLSKAEAEALGGWR